MCWRPLAQLGLPSKDPLDPSLFRLSDRCIESATCPPVEPSAFLERMQPSPTLAIPTSLDGRFLPTLDRPFWVPHSTLATIRLPIHSTLARLPSECMQSRSPLVCVGPSRRTLSIPWCVYCTLPLVLCGIRAISIDPLKRCKHKESSVNHRLTRSLLSQAQEQPRSVAFLLFLCFRFLHCLLRCATRRVRAAL